MSEFCEMAYGPRVHTMMWSYLMEDYYCGGDLIDGVEVNTTRLVEEIAKEFGVADEGGPLDDETHWIWDTGHEVACSFEDYLPELEEQAE